MELFRPATFGSALKLVSDCPDEHLLLVRAEMCYPVQTPLDIWTRQNAMKLTPSPRPTNEVFALHRRVYLEPEDHKRIKKSVYDYNPHGLPTKQTLSLAVKNQRKTPKKKKTPSA
jgi:hypothetical protein